MPLRAGQPADDIMNRAYDKFTRLFLNVVQPYDLDGPPPTPHVWSYLGAILKPFRKVIAASLVFTTLTACLDVWVIHYAGELIDILASSERSSFWQEEWRGMLYAALVLLLLRPMLQFLRHATNGIMFEGNAATLVRWRAYHHLADQSIGWFQEDLAGRTSSRLVDIGNNAANTIHNVLNALAFGAVYMVGLVILLASIEIKLALPLLVWFVLYVTVLRVVIPLLTDAMEDFFAAKSALMGSVVDSFTNFDTLKLFAPKNFIAKEQRLRLEDTRQALVRARQIGTALRTTLAFLEGVMMVGIIGYGVWLWSAEVTTIGIVSAGVALSLRLAALADWIFDSIWSVFQQIGALRESLQTIGQPIVMPQQSGAPALNITAGGIKITNLSHHYGKTYNGLDGISLTIKPGEKVGLIGKSGAGKSTLVNLILRFFEAEDGSIEIDGQDIRAIDQDSLRNAFGMVTQQASLFNRSVRDNINLGRDDISDEVMIAAAREAKAHDFIMDLEDTKGRKGYDAFVGERGIKLSGGQRQRIALARAILKNAPIMILDEATSALDSEVEAEIQDALTTVMENKTVIAIAHRLSTIAHMDRIVVMDKGQIVEQGSHSELLALDGHYARFWNRQSGGFIGTEAVAPPSYGT